MYAHSDTISSMEPVVNALTVKSMTQTPKLAGCILLLSVDSINTGLDVAAFAKKASSE